MGANEVLRFIELAASVVAASLGILTGIRSREPRSAARSVNSDRICRPIAVLCILKHKKMNTNLQA